MRVAIDPPAKRSLNPNEQRVLGLLREGLEPLEIARQLHMALQISNLANRHDVPPDTVMGLIASIREKGWDIPNYNKEDDNMSRGQKTPVEKVREISVLKDEGKTHQQIAEITGVPVSTVGKVCARLGKAETKKEPAPSANGTSTKEIISTTNIVPENPANVNTPDKISEAEKAVPDAVTEACRRMREDELSKINVLLDEVDFRRGRVGELEKFLREGQK